MSEIEYVVAKIKSLPESSLEEVVDFIEFLEKKKKKAIAEKEDSILKIIGICEGPSDLAEKHDKYVYG